MEYYAQEIEQLKNIIRERDKALQVVLSSSWLTN